jgi:hypothetical protein
MSIFFTGFYSEGFAELIAQHQTLETVSFHFMWPSAWFQLCPVLASLPHLSSCTVEPLEDVVIATDNDAGELGQLIQTPSLSTLRMTQFNIQTARAAQIVSQALETSSVQKMFW